MAIAARIDLRKTQKEENTMQKKMSTFEKVFREEGRAEGLAEGEAKGRAEGEARRKEELKAKRKEELKEETIRFWSSSKASGTIMSWISRYMKNC